VLTELAVTNLGVIGRVRVVLGPGMTALTGETGAGKTMLVEAIELLVGGRADPALVRPGADEAVVEGRFIIDEDEVVLTRVIPAVGRSRGYVDGRLAPASALADWGARLVDLHGQHAHQSLLGVATQRAALDHFGGIDLEPLRAARTKVTEIEAALAELGGDERARAREIDLLRFQVDELTAAALAGADEDERLAAEEELLADAIAHQAAAAVAVAALAEEGGAIDGVGSAIAAVVARAPFGALHDRLRDVAAELADIVSELRATGEAITDDPERQSVVRARRQLLHELRRKYGETLAEVIEFAADAAHRLAELESHDERAGALDRARRDALAEVDRAAAVVGTARRAAAPELGSAVEAHLVELAMPKAHVGVEVGDADPGDEVAFLLSANPGSPRLPLAKVASGGELARAMLALRLVMVGDRSGPRTLVFDEVDAGVGGVAASAVGQALARLADERQVLVVTHLAQVAACADTQIAITKADDGATTAASVIVLDHEERVIELSRMLSGSPDSTSAREHAAELLEEAGRR
jgi:DNA repair protein RecN (Recombination protein N)